MPFLSVLVLCYDRREYLLEAVRSVVGPAGPAVDFEVLVLKNFTDPVIDAELRRLGAVCPPVRGTNQGAWLAEAMDSARGEVIVFLDDDDLFLPEKLAVVRDEFAREPRLSYYHNGHSTVGAVGPIPDPEARSSPGRTESPRLVVAADDRARTTLVALWRAGAAFNLSSIAVRHRAIESARPEITQVRISSSAFLYFNALSAPGVLVADARVLTAYRVHASNASGSGSATTDDRWSRELLRAPRTAADCDVILATLHGRSAARSVRRPVEVARSRVRLLAAVGAERVSRARVLLRVFQLVWVSLPGDLRESRPYLRWGLAVLRAGGRPRSSAG